MATGCSDDQPGNQTATLNDQSSAIAFEMVPPSHSGIDFNNEIRENPRLNYFVWNFIYQGAGVGIGDINNDGLDDIYLAGNMVPDRLYLNKGNFEFEDISQSAGIQDRLWSTGVNMVDVNADGLLDIYVCKNFFLLQDAVRTNKLYINNGDLSFTESAKTYGLDDAGFSIQSTFNDFDNDGDLDMYLINQPMDQYAATLGKPENIAKMPFSDKIYRNDGTRFTDITDEIRLRNRSYGLNGMAADFTGDGWNDLYVCNDYNKGDLLLINSGRFAFENQIHSRLDHSSFYSMGADAADINNDGWLDFITLDMAYSSHYRSKTNMGSMDVDLFWKLVDEGEHYQYPVNNLQLNMGDGYFSEIGHLAGVSHTDWSWAPLFEDFDHDGYKDLMITNGLIRDLRNNDFISKMQENPNLKNQNYEQLLQSIPSNPVNNLIFKNSGHLQFEDVSMTSGFDAKNFSSGAASSDLDGDGDIDLVINNSNGLTGIYKNVSKQKNNYLKVKLEGKIFNPQGIGASVSIKYGPERQTAVVASNRGYMSSGSKVLHFGVGQSETIDSVIVYWDHINRSVVRNVAVNQMLTINYNATKSDRQPLQANRSVHVAPITQYRHIENEYNEYESQILLPHEIGKNGPTIAIGDINKDGMDDIIAGASSGFAAELWLQSSDGKFNKQSVQAFDVDKKYEDLGIVIADLNADSKLDLYFVSGSANYNQQDTRHSDRIYLGDGNGGFNSEDMQIPDLRLDGQVIIIEDINQDGYPDIFLGTRAKANAYPEGGPAALLLGEEGGWQNKSDIWLQEFPDSEMMTDAIACDIDSDGDLDILTVGEWMPIRLLINEGDKFRTKELDIFGHNSHGLWWSIEKGDFDNDGDPDLIVGNLGANNKFKASEKTPFSIYSGDLDSNGDHDILLAKYSGNKTVPVRGKECSTEEMPFISEKYKSYEDYARASLEEIFDSGILDSAHNASIKNLQSIYLENKGNRQFEASLLPIECQFGPIKDVITVDFNEDGHLDFAFGGAHHPVEVETVRYDGLKGGVAYGQGNGEFEVAIGTDSPFFLSSDFRQMEKIVIGGTTHLIIASNQDSLRVLDFSFE